MHEAYPGHHVDGLKRKENPRLLRKVVRESIMSEGWGLFTEEMMFEQGFLQGDDVRLTQLRNRLWRAARVIIDASLHTGRMTYDEAVTFLADKVRFDRYAAALDVDMYTVRPTYVLGYLIGMQEIEAHPQRLHREVRRAVAAERVLRSLAERRLDSAGAGARIAVCAEGRRSRCE